MLTLLKKMGDVLAHMEHLIEELLGRKAMFVATWLFHGLVGFVLGAIFGLVGFGIAIGMYGYREIDGAMVWGYSLDGAMDFLSPLVFGAVGVQVGLFPVV